MITAPPNLHCKQSSGSLIVGPEDLIKLQESYQMIFCKEFEKNTKQNKQKTSKSSLLNTPNELNNGKHIYNVL